MLSVKQGGIKYYFLSPWYDSTEDWTPVSWTIGEHSIHEANAFSHSFSERTFFFHELLEILFTFNDISSFFHDLVGHIKTGSCNVRLLEIFSF